MDWQSLIVGAVIGGAVGIVMQNLLFPSVELRWKARRRRHFYAKSLQAWSRIEQLHPRLVLVQAGWDQDGSFPEGSVVLRLGSSFLPGDEASHFRQAHADEWATQGLTDGEQVGIASISNTRTSDEPARELAGRAHALTITVHRYRFYDFLATHVLRLHGTGEERAILDALAGFVGPDQPAAGFPTPCSVGLSLFCEGGTRLVLPRRSASSGSGGYWAPGKIFNAVGENAAVRDFAAANRQAHESTPHAIARRGLYEEMGFLDEDIAGAAIHLHSFAWASDLLDFKFFGSVETPLTRSEVQDRWRGAPDRSEISGIELNSWPVESAQDCRDLLATMRDNPTDWSPEAVFSTLRSFVTLRRFSTDDILRAISSG